MLEPLIRVKVRIPPAPSKGIRVAAVVAQFLGRGAGEGLARRLRSHELVAVNRKGIEWPLFPVATMQEGFQKVTRVQSELESLGLRAWCERYRVPPEFVVEHERDSEPPGRHLRRGRYIHPPGQ